MIVNYTADNDYSRLDVYISEINQDYSRSYFKTLIKNGNVAVNGAVVTKAGTPLVSGDKIEIDIPDPVSSDNKPQDIPLDIVYEDRDFLVINKAAGVATVPAHNVAEQDSLVNRVK